MCRSNQSAAYTPLHGCPRVQVWMGYAPVSYLSNWGLGAHTCHMCCTLVSLSLMKKGCDSVAVTLQLYWCSTLFHTQFYVIVVHFLDRTCRFRQHFKLSAE